MDGRGHVPGSHCIALRAPRPPAAAAARAVGVAGVAALGQAACGGGHPHADAASAAAQVARRLRVARVSARRAARSRAGPHAGAVHVGGGAAMPARVARRRGWGARAGVEAVLRHSLPGIGRPMLLGHRAAVRLGEVRRGAGMGTMPRMRHRMLLLLLLLLLLGGAGCEREAVPRHGPRHAAVWKPMRQTVRRAGGVRAARPGLGRCGRRAGARTGGWGLQRSLHGRRGRGGWR